MNDKNKISKVKMMTFVALLSALGFVLMLLDFPLPFIPPFLKMDFSPIVEIMGAFLFGPVASIAIIVVKILLKLAVKGTSSFGIGELQNLLIGLSYTIPASLIYIKGKTKKNAMYGLLIGTLAAIVMAVITNLYIMFPFYAKLMGTDMAGLVGMFSKVNPLAKTTFTMALFALVPFNLVKYGISSVLTMLLYKRLSKIIKGIIYK